MQTNSDKYQSLTWSKKQYLIPHNSHHFFSADLPWVVMTAATVPLLIPNDPNHLLIWASSLLTRSPILFINGVPYKSLLIVGPRYHPAHRHKSWLSSLNLLIPAGRIEIPRLFISTRRKLIARFVTGASNVSFLRLNLDQMTFPLVASSLITKTPNFHPSETVSPIMFLIPQPGFARYRWLGLSVGSFLLSRCLPNLAPFPVFSPVEMDLRYWATTQ